MTAFGTAFASTMSTSRWDADGFAEPELGPVEPIPLHPAAHVLHYASSCFEGLKAHKGTDDEVRIFRAARHVERMQQSAAQLRLPVPPTELLHGMIRDVVAKNKAEVPDTPGSLYIRPLLFGSAPNIGAAAAPPSEGWLLVLPSPVGDYFAGGLRPLKLLIETSIPRTTPHFGMVKSGANYVQALPITLDAKARYGVDQILFAPGGDVQETGAANFLLLDDDRVVTRKLDSSFLHGVTRDSILTIARDLGYAVEERDLPLDEVLAWPGEAALSGTAAVLAPVGTLVHQDEEITINDGEVGPNLRRLRDALLAIQRGEAEDAHGWCEPV